MWHATNRMPGRAGHAKRRDARHGKYFRLHGTRKDAFNCRKRHLLDSGYIAVGTREFLAPPVFGGGVLVLNSLSTFGTEFRPDKPKDDSNRWRPKHGNGRGCII